MKSLTTLLVCLVIITSVNAQWQGTNPVYFNSGNVGVGTSAPSSWFGGKAFEISDTRPVLKLTSTSQLGTITFTNSAINGSTHTGEFHINHDFVSATPDQTTLRFGSYPGGSPFAIRADGHLAMAEDKQFRLRSMANNEVTFGFDVASATLRITNTRDVYDRFISLGSYAPGGGTWVSQLALNTKNGNIGIGNTAPTQKLDVTGNIIAGDGSSVYWQGFKSNAPTNKWGFQQNEILFVGVGGNVYSKGFSSNAMGIFNGSLTKEDVFLYNVNSSNGDYLVLKASGNVGIGTNNADAKLTVAGDVNAREVRVTVNAGADFVFEKNYALPKLADVAKFIRENNHLPEIASAEEMKENGMKLSEMNIKLLQKVEELTLYMIEFQNQMDQLKKENAELKKAITEK